MSKVDDFIQRKPTFSYFIFTLPLYKCIILGVPKYSTPLLVFGHITLLWLLWIFFWPIDLIFFNFLPTFNFFTLFDSLLKRVYSAHLIYSPSFLMYFTNLKVIAFNALLRIQLVIRYSKYHTFTWLSYQYQYIAS